MPTLKELAIEYAKKQTKQVDSLLEGSPVLDMIPFSAASHGMWNVYEELAAVTGASWVDLNAALPTVSRATELKKVDLNILGGEMEVPEDTAKLFGGKDKYFGKHLPAILKKSGMNAEYKILYDNFRAFAIAAGTVASAGGANNINFSILAVRFEEGVCEGLYSPDGFKNGAMLDFMAINGGNIYKNSAGVLVYGMRLKNYFGMQIASAKNVGAVVNIDINNIPTAAQIDDLLADVRADGRTFLFMHQKCKNLLNVYKSGSNTNTEGAGSLQTMPSSKDIDRTFDAWNGVKIITSYNFLEGTEPNVTVP